MSLVLAATLLASQPTASLRFPYDFPEQASPNNPAIDSRLNSAFLECVRNQAIDLPTKNRCISKERSQQDQTLNFTYQSVMQRQSPERREALRAAERAWIKGVASYCRQQDAEITDGTDTPCIITETIRRTIWLEKLR